MAGKISLFTFQVVYIEGSENVMADALSRLYSNDSPGTIRSQSEFTYHDVVDDDTSTVQQDLPSDVPILAGMEARVATRRGSRVRRLTEKAALALDDRSVELPSPKRPSRVRDCGGPQEGGSRNSPTSSVPVPSAPPVVDPPREMVSTSTHQVDGNEVSSLLTQSSLGLDLLAELQGRYTEDPFFRVILEKPNEFQNFKAKEQILYLKEHDKRVLCIPKVMIQGRNAREIIIFEAHSMLAHLGASKTLDYLRDNVWW